MEIFKKTKSKNKIIYLLGDLADVSNTRIGTWEWSMTCDDQVNKLTSLLKPYRKYIRFMVSGNHPARVRKDYNLDLGKIISENLNIPYNSTDFFDTLKINDQEFTIYGKHGTRFSKSLRLAERGFIQDMTNIDADLFIQGHNHYGAFFNNPYRTRDGGIGRKYYGFTGHYINYFQSYARVKGMTVSPESFIRLSINKNLKVSGDEYHIDRECPELMMK
jgi:predicted MPP superfamily phosphohydrolase